MPAKRKKAFKLIPGPVVAVVLGILFQASTTRFAPSWALDSTHLVSVPIAGTFSEAAALLSHPDWSRILDASIWVAALNAGGRSQPRDALVCRGD